MLSSNVTTSSAMARIILCKGATAFSNSFLVTNTSVIALACSADKPAFCNATMASIMCFSLFFSASRVAAVSVTRLWSKTKPNVMASISRKVGGYQAVSGRLGIRASGQNWEDLQLILAGRSLGVTQLQSLFPLVNSTCFMLTKELSTANRAQPVFIEPMRVVAVAELPDGEAWSYEAKLDGYRCLAAKRGEWSRTLVTRREWVYRPVSADCPCL